MINSLFSFREYLSLQLGHYLVKPRPDDQYLISYPRSGNTWMRTMLGVLVNMSAEGNPDFTRQTIPGVSISNSKKINSLKSPRLIKSHTWFRKDISRAVYIVRDGRDVLISLYHYYITRQGRNLTFSDFYFGYINGKYGQLWHKNVESWLVNGRDQLIDNLLIISFETIKDNPAENLTRAAWFLDLPVDENQIKKAVELANISRMRNIEIQRRGPIKNENASFYRGGKTGEWKDYFTPEIETSYLRVAGKALSLAGYL